MYIYDLINKVVSRLLESDGKYEKIESEENGKRNVVKVIAIMVISLLIAFTMVYVAWKYECYMEKCPILRIIITILIGLILFFIKSLFTKNYNLCENPYNFDFGVELKKYNSIGIKKNLVKKDACSFEKYSAWENYIRAKFNAQIDIINREDFYRFIKRKYRNAMAEKELFGMLTIPIEMVYIAALYSGCSSGELFRYLVSLLMIVIVVATAAVFYYFYIEKEIAFLVDFCEIAFDKKEDLIKG